MLFLGIILAIVIPFFIGYFVFCAKFGDQVKQMNENAEFLKNSVHTPIESDDTLDVVGMQYRGINFEFNCDAVLVKERNENGKGGWAVAVYSKDRNIHLGYIPEEDKKDALKLIRTKRANGWMSNEIHNNKCYGYFYC